MSSEADARRKARLSAALRDNLKRRKAQIRSRDAGEAVSGGVAVTREEQPDCAESGGAPAVPNVPSTAAPREGEGGSGDETP